MVLNAFFNIISVILCLPLTHYQTTNFRLFRIERLCRRQFQIWRKWEKVIQTGRKHCGKRRNCSLRAISPFPSVFKRLVSQGFSKGVIVWEWVNKCFPELIFTNRSWSYYLGVYSFRYSEYSERVLDQWNISEQCAMFFRTCSGCSK